MRASLLFAIPGTLAQGNYFDYYEDNDIETINLPEGSVDDDSLPAFGDFNYESESNPEGIEYFEITSYSGDEPEVSLGDDDSQRTFLHESFNAQEEDDGTITSLVKYQIKKTKRPSKKSKKQKLDKKQDNYQEIKYLESKSAQSSLPWLDMISHIHMVEIGNIGKNYAVKSKEMTKKLGEYGCWCSLLFPPKKKKRNRKKRPVYEAPTNQFLFNCLKNFLTSKKAIGKIDY